MAMSLFRIIERQVLHQQWSRTDYGHVTLEDVEEFREFIEAGAAEELAVFGKAHIVREQVAVCVLLVGHGAELDELEDFFAFAGAGLREEGVALHLDGAEDCKHNEERAQADDGCKCTEEVQDSF